MNRVAGVVIRLGAVAAFLYLIVLLALFSLQRDLVFQPDTRLATPARAGLESYQAIEIEPGQRSWWHAPPDPGAPVIIHFHGNGGSLANRTTLLGDLEQMQFGVLAVEYPGYGGNDGSPSEKEIQRLARANYDWLLKQGVRPDRIIIHGHSMGTGVAVPLAAEVQSAGVILEAPFTSLSDIAASQYPFVPVRLLLRDPFESMSHIQKVKGPLVWIHGKQDSLIPSHYGQTLFNAVRARSKCGFIFPDGNHDNLWFVGGKNIVELQVKTMVAERRCQPQSP